MKDIKHLKDIIQNALHWMQPFFTVHHQLRSCESKLYSLYWTDRPTCSKINIFDDESGWHCLGVVWMVQNALFIWQ